MQPDLRRPSWGLRQRKQLSEEKIKHEGKHSYREGRVCILQEEKLEEHTCVVRECDYLQFVFSKDAAKQVKRCFLCNKLKLFKVEALLIHSGREFQYLTEL